MSYAGALVSKSAERYTPPEIIVPATLALGGRIGLDPASCPKANEYVRAGRIFTKADNGLGQPWCQPSGEPEDVWNNPPSTKRGYVDAGGQRHHEPAVWWSKLIAEHEAGRVRRAIFLIFALGTLRWTACYPSVPHPCSGRFKVVWLYDRIRFYDAAGKRLPQPPQDNVLVLVGDVDPEPLRALGRITP